ncbi:MAG: hypothetical protein QM773_07865 [Hyphomonadaceae bacterium]
MRQLLAVILLAACSAPTPIDSAHSSASPQLKPETIGGCNAVNLKINLAADGTIRVNGDPSSMEGVKVAALKKDAACQNAAAMVVYSYDTESPAEPRDAIKLLLEQTIVNLSLIEAGQG